MNEGPTLTLAKCCDGCAYLRSEYYQRQGYSGFDYRCTALARKLSSVLTPDDCPFMEVALEDHWRLVAIRIAGYAKGEP